MLLQDVDKAVYLYIVTRVIGLAECCIGMHKSPVQSITKSITKVRLQVQFAIENDGPALV